MRPTHAPLLALALLAVVAGGCTGFLQAPVVPPLAVLYTDVAAPLDTEFEATERGALRGTASSYNVLGLVSWGDASATQAAQAGGIRVIRHADYEFKNVLWVWSRYTTVVYGD